MLLKSVVPFPKNLPREGILFCRSRRLESCVLKAHKDTEILCGDVKLKTFLVSMLQNIQRNPSPVSYLCIFVPLIQFYLR